MKTAQSAPALDDRLIRCMASEALDRIIGSSKPKLLFWDTSSNRLRAVGADAARAKTVLTQPTCLGIYDFEVKLQDIIDDFKAICQS
ncbi:MAG: hypothetical protein KAX55_00760 [Propionivibrio sp.]|nr:hypothetical protein [Propionivibrio sp.]